MEHHLTETQKERISFIQSTHLVKHFDRTTWKQMCYHASWFVSEFQSEVVMRQHVLSFSLKGRSSCASGLRLKQLKRGVGQFERSVMCITYFYNLGLRVWQFLNSPRGQLTTSWSLNRRESDMTKFDKQLLKHYISLEEIWKDFSCQNPN